MGRGGFEVVLFAAACVLHEHGGEGIGQQVYLSNLEILLLNPSIVAAFRSGSFHLPKLGSSTAMLDKRHPLTV